jgi:hypothetical protein
MDDVRPIANRFQFEGEFQSAVRYGNGHINDTYAVRYTSADGTSRRYILQRINHHVFRYPVRLMQNMVAVSDHIRTRVAAAGGDPDRGAVTVVPTREGAHFFQHDDGTFWRGQVFIEGSLCIDQVEDVRHLYEAGRAFGDFQRMLGDFPVECLHETIPDFHNTPVRLRAFEIVVAEDPVGRVASVASDVAFVRARSPEAGRLVGLLAEGSLPLRVTHNDTKLNNVLFDETSGKAVCVIDLDTVMPGLSLYDFGDAIRFAANTAVEDETDLDKVHLDFALFENFTRGFLESAGPVLNEEEKRQLCFSARLITFELAVRFLSDHIAGDPYFRIHRTNHNLDRARCQFRLLEEMERNEEKMEDIVRRILAETSTGTSVL